MKFIHFQVEWLPLSIFDSHAQFAVAFDETHTLDVHISGDAMTVTSYTDDGDYRVVNFGSSKDFESFAKHTMKRIGKKKGEN